MAVFHRQNGSGCKSVFLETANHALREKGLKLEMELYVPLSEEGANAVPTNIAVPWAGTGPSPRVRAPEGQNGLASSGRFCYT